MPRHNTSARLYRLVTARRTASGIDDPVVARVIASAATAMSSERVRREMIQSPIRLLIVDAEPVMLIGLRALLGVARRCHVVGEATTAEGALEIARVEHPDVVIINADLVAAAGIVVLRRMLGELSGVRAMIFGSVADPRLATAAMHAGVSGYVLKQTDPARLVDAIETVAGGGVVLDECVTDAVVKWFRAGRPVDEPLERLSSQEHRILRQIVAGRTNRQIAATLNLSNYTVKTYVSSLLKKLELSSRAEAAALFVRRESATAK